MAEPKFDLPGTLRIGTYDLRIERWDTNEANHRSRFGESSMSLQLVKVDCNYGSRRAAHTLLHEALHCLLREYGQDYRFKDEHDEERLVATPANGLCSMWRDNPELMAFLNKELA